MRTSTGPNTEPRAYASPFQRANASMYNNAFTLLEILITLCVLSILTTLSLPTFTAIKQHHYANTVFNDLYTTLHFARQSALLQKQPVTICASISHRHCDTSDWSSGLIVFIDKNNNHMMDEADTLIRQIPAIEQGKLIWNGSASAYLTYQPNGMTINHMGAFYFYNDNSLKWKIIISRAGRVRNQ